jgi:hypothetical protein
MSLAREQGVLLVGARLALRVVGTVRQRTAEEALADLERKIAERFGPAGLQLLAEGRR